MAGSDRQVMTGQAASRKSWTSSRLIIDLKKRHYISRFIWPVTSGSSHMHWQVGHKLQGQLTSEQVYNPEY